MSRTATGFLATFRDILEAATGAPTREETLELAEDALVTAIDYYFEDQRQVPLPSAAEPGENLVALPVSL
ncbi:hypothetical protein CupriaWKF_33235 [Cupriavidus sp. WKF15]|uniref:type II toxin-antitoxin system HicB family antitoxin n=1 Tax=Cupriavidus sp. WKF15 TaxID=3032282 RepID=UPI0023E192DC|nr:hypothetical protein [Cupriavidus sp. WKF15]WER50429.1 hypothetical protein CupriaWKF_33235 [Cupriavidus sp. WKF15]